MEHPGKILKVGVLISIDNGKGLSATTGPNTTYKTTATKEAYTESFIRRTYLKSSPYRSSLNDRNCTICSEVKPKEESKIGLHDMTLQKTRKYSDKI